MGLCSPETLIDGAIRQQLSVATGRDNATAVNNDDSSQKLEQGGRQTMCDQNCRPSDDKVAERQVNQLLTVCINGRCWFIQDQDSRIAQDGSSQGDPLPLTARQVFPMLADQGFQPEWH